MNASDERGIDVVRDQVVNFAQTKNLHVGDGEQNLPKLIILDEADAMTKDAQNALRSVFQCLLFVYFLLSKRHAYLCCCVVLLINFKKSFERQVLSTTTALENDNDGICQVVQ